MAETPVEKEKKGLNKKTARDTSLAESQRLE
jgi:hypothetical protein